MSSKQIIRRNLICSTYEGSCYSLMVGLSETYFAAFYLALGISEFGVGLLATIPYLLGSVLQLWTPWGVRRFNSYRRWTICTAGLQGLSLLALSGLACVGQLSFASLLAFATIYWASGLATGPAWNTWIEFVVPKRVRANYFSIRMRICQLCLLVGIALAGSLLRIFDSSSQHLWVFVGLFAAAGILRLMSSRALSTQIEHRNWLRSNYEAARGPKDPELVSLTKTMIVFFAAMQFAVYISGPYFAPFMLKNLELGYLQYMMLILAGYSGRILALPYAAKLVKQKGSVRLLLWGAWGIVPMSSLWLFHQSFFGLLAIQLASGAAWGCYELGVSLSYLERIPCHHRMRVLSLLNIFNGSAMVLGSVFGGLILQYFSKSDNAFMAVFLISAVFRIVAMFWFPTRLLETAPIGQPLIPKTECRDTIHATSPALAGMNATTNVRPYRQPTAGGTKFEHAPAMSKTI